MKLIREPRGDFFRAMPGRALTGFLLALLLLTGCRALPPGPPLNLNEPGWQVRRGQAVWRYSKKAPELAGEILLAEKGPTTCLVQFSKNPVPIVEARVQGTRWQIRFVPQNFLFGGDHVAASRFTWLRLSAALAGEPLGEKWSFEQPSEGHWRLENRSTGEVLEGFFLPEKTGK